MKSFVLLLLLIHLSTVLSAASNKLEDRYLSDKVCHDVDKLEVEVAGYEVTCGGKLSYESLSSSAESPLFRYKKAIEDTLYLILIVEVGESAECRFRTEIHYMIGDVPGKELAKGNTGTASNDKNVFSVYFPPLLSNRSPEHRFFIYAFTQTNPMADLAIPSARCFDLNKFTDDESLKLEAANMFKTQNSKP